ncbi:hypothetical protein EVAR_91410_1 [Eumeta japonica]|uniref:Uncharacterized protein n=1 Tax=Eumeta variegata TaxID=151549 RepID=A0A4C1XD49_EUMVA|nr:hypothetical protein EVAR_91410_1 [Eumeta japonica]
MSGDFLCQYDSLEESPIELSRAVRTPVCFPAAFGEAIIASQPTALPTHYSFREIFLVGFSPTLTEDTRAGVRYAFFISSSLQEDKKKYLYKFLNVQYFLIALCTLLETQDVLIVSCQVCLPIKFKSHSSLVMRSRPPVATTVLLSRCVTVTQIFGRRRTNPSPTRMRTTRAR